MQNTNSAISIFDALNALILSSFEFQCKKNFGCIKMFTQVATQTMMINYPYLMQ